MSELTTEDELHEMIVCCYEAWDNKRKNPASIARKAISEGIRRRKYEAATLYNGRRNISLNQSFGDSKTPASDFLNLSEWQEWD